MKLPPPAPLYGLRRVNCHGAAMLAVLAFIICGMIMLTGVMHLMAARLQQTERMSVEVQRHVAWGNSKALNQQYAFTWALRDNVTRSASTATLSNWGGVDAAAFTGLRAFRSTLRPANTTYSYPFNNVFPTGTADSGVYFERTSADSDSSQTEHLFFYNYLKTYPATLLGDLLVVHKKAASGSYYLSDNFQVNGRVVLWDSTAESINLRAQSCLNMIEGATNTTKNTAFSATLLPQNLPSTVRVTAGAGTGGTNPAVVDGTLNMINNADFTPGSLRHIIEASGAQGTTWLTCSTASGSSTNINTTSANGTTTSDTQVKLESTPVYPPPTTSPYGYTASSSLNVLIVRLKNPTLKHLRITSGVEQLVLQGQTSTTDYTNVGSLAPVIIWLEQSDCRDIRFVGENNRRLILATGKGAGATVYASFHGASLVTGGPLRWRLQWINEYRQPYLHIAGSAASALLTGGIRTDWGLYCTDTGTTVRFTLEKETSPGALETLLPRDGWLEPYMLIR